MTTSHVAALEKRILFSSVFNNDPVATIDSDQQRISLPINSPTPGPVSVMAVGDFNGDHKVDIVARSSNEAVVRFYAGHGDGKFGPPGAGIGAGANPTAMVVADFNGDHNLDIAVANNSGPVLTIMSSVTILLGNGDGTFTKGVSAFGGQLPTALATADVNHDGAMDIIVANAGQWSPPGTEQPATYGAGVLLGNGDGTFQGVRKVFLDNPQNSLAVGDVNGDGAADAVLGGPLQQAATVLPMARMWTLLGDGSGSFAVNAAVAFPGKVGGLLLADLNGDHNDDVAAVQVFASSPTASTYPGDSSVRTLLSNGDGTFTAKSAVPTPIIRAAGISAADFNNDGKLDFVVAGSSSLRTILPVAVTFGTVAVVPGLGDGKLGPPLLFRTGALPAVQAVADVNNDGLPDIITGGVSGFSVLLNHPKPTATDLAGLNDGDVLLA
jgi:hypothetical protein